MGELDKNEVWQAAIKLCTAFLSEHNRNRYLAEVSIYDANREETAEWNIMFERIKS